MKGEDFVKAHDRVKDFDWQASYVEDPDRYPMAYKIPAKTSDPFRHLVRDYCSMERDKDDRQYGAMSDVMARAKMPAKASERWTEVLKMVLPVTTYAEYAAMKCTGQLVDAVDNAELRQGYLAQMIDEVRHVNQEAHLARYTLGLLAIVLYQTDTQRRDVVENLQQRVNVRMRQQVQQTRAVISTIVTCKVERIQSESLHLDLRSCILLLGSLCRFLFCFDRTWYTQSCQRAWRVVHIVLWFGRVPYKFHPLQRREQRRVDRRSVQMVLLLLSFVLTAAATRIATTITRKRRFLLQLSIKWIALFMSAGWLLCSMVHLFNYVDDGNARIDGR